MKSSPELNELATALSKAQGIIQNPNKDAANPFFKSKYADLADVLNVVRPAFSECGLSVVQMPVNVDGNVGVVTRLMHSSGQWLEDSIDIPLQGKNIAQDAGSTITYLRRYALASVSAVFQEDLDANLGKGKGTNTAPVQSIKSNPQVAGENLPAPEPAIVITPPEIKVIEDLIAKTDTDKQVFCDYLKVSDTSDIMSNQYAKAVSALEKKWEQMNAG